jgi:pyruvate/2-oxoglutarate dehydrogenase complex dihydrolipoamide dehydrogenase (E3) component
MRRYRDYLVSQVRKRSIKVLLNTSCNAGLIDDLQPDKVIAAVGAHPLIPSFSGMDKLCSGDAVYAHEHAAELGSKVVVIGGGLVGCETALHLKMTGKDVVLIEMEDDIARDANMFYRSAIEEQIGNYKLKVMTRTYCEAFSEQGVIVSVNGEKKEIPCDTAIISVGMVSNKETVEELRRKVGFGDFREIGDCYKPGTIRQAVHHGYFAAIDVV